MMSNVQNLRSFLAANAAAALVEVAGTKGSTPRETGAYMLVSPSATYGTIGGGQLEYMAIDKARQMLRALPSPLRGGSTGGAGRGGGPKGSARQKNTPTPDLRSDLPLKGEGDVARIDVHEVCATLDVPLGPEIGQCCGGRVEVLIRTVDATLAAELVRAAEEGEAQFPHVYLFGGGHVGKALATAMTLLPVHVVVIETRTEELEGMPEAVEKKLTPMPEEMVREAPAGAAFVVLTHDHALDFLIVAEALKRSDAAYVGMIGSKTKKATFKNWFVKNAGGSEAEFSHLVSPIGGDRVKDKRPAVIAALAAAEIVTALALYASNAEKAATDLVTARR